MKIFHLHISPLPLLRFRSRPFFHAPAPAKKGRLHNTAPLLLKHWSSIGFKSFTYVKYLGMFKWSKNKLIKF